MAPIGANFAVERLGDRSQEVAVTDQERDQENETDSADEQESVTSPPVAASFGGAVSVTRKE